MPLPERDRVGRGACVGPCVLARTRLEQDAGDLLVTILGTDHERGEAVGLGVVDVRPLLDHDADALLVTAVTSLHERRPACVVMSAHVSARLEQDLLVTVLGTEHERCEALVLGRFEVGRPAREQCFTVTRVAVFNTLLHINNL